MRRSPVIGAFLDEVVLTTLTGLEIEMKTVIAMLVLASILVTSGCAAGLGAVATRAYEVGRPVEGVILNRAANSAQQVENPQADPVGQLGSDLAELAILGFLRGRPRVRRGARSKRWWRRRPVLERRR